VTYTVVVETDNSDGKLLPYLTANLQFQVAEHKDALLVPNAALRWKPTSPDQVAPDARADYAQSRRQQAGEKAAAAAGEAKPKPAGTEKDTHERALVWAQDGKYVRPVNVRIGLSDGAMTEVVKGDLQPGTALVVGENHGGGPEGTTNPFTPQMSGGNKKQ
jgi:HlyD family secretion protein